MTVENRYGRVSPVSWAAALETSRAFATSAGLTARDGVPHPAGRSLLLVMNPVVTLINLLVVAPAVLGRVVGLPVAGVPVALSWHSLGLVPLIGYAGLLAGLGLLLVVAGLKLFGQCFSPE
jgi:hypothetical protein